MRRLMVVGVAFVTAAAAACSEPGVAKNDHRDELVVRIDSGLVDGRVDDGVRRFDGIPFARPPVGELRWVAPQPLEPWDGVRDAKQPGSRCSQPDVPGGELSFAEDCLYLNVTTPRRGTGVEHKPVMVWIHGGSFNTGAGADYDPKRLAADGDVVVVTVNYRLGPLGFLAHPAMGKDGGNFGMQDQVAALRWVQRNAASFGGDPGNVSVFGESAGGYSTCMLLTSPQTVDLIDKAIPQSGSCSVFFGKNVLTRGSVRYLPYISLEAARGLGVAAAAQLKCDQVPDVIGCLRKTDVKTWHDPGLVSKLSNPVYDTGLFPENPAEVAQQGRAHQVPVVIGVTRDEMRLLVGLQTGAGVRFDDAYYQGLLTDSFDADAAKVKATYPVGQQGKYAAALAWAAVATDEGWVCGAIEDARTFSTRPAPVYAYIFGDRDAPNYTADAKNKFPIPPDFPVGAIHGSELPSLFPTKSLGTPEQHQLSKQMIQYWSRFAHSGDPNGPDLPRWDQFRNQDTVQGFGYAGARDISPINLNEQHHCDLWKSVSRR